RCLGQAGRGGEVAEGTGRVERATVTAANADPRVRAGRLERAVAEAADLAKSRPATQAACITSLEAALSDVLPDLRNRITDLEGALVRLLPPGVATALILDGLRPARENAPRSAPPATERRLSG